MKKPSNLVRRSGNKLYLNLCSTNPRWCMVDLDGLFVAKSVPIPEQENGYRLALNYKDESSVDFCPIDHSMGFTRAEINEIILAI